MKKLLVLLLVLFCVSNVYSQNDSTFKVDREEIELDSIWILPNWGDEEIEFELEIKSTQTEIKNSHISSDTSFSDVAVKIIPIETGQWRVRWQVKDVRFDRPKGELELQIAAIPENFAFDFTLDENGQFMGLNNWEEIHKKANEAIDTIFLPMRGIEAFDQYRAAVSQKYNTKEEVEIFCMKEIVLYFNTFGLCLHRDDPVEEVLYTLNPVTGDSTRQVCITTFPNAYSDNTYDITIRQYIDDPELKEKVISTMDAAIEDGLEVDDKDEMDAAIPSLEGGYKLNNDFNISLESGLAHRAVAEKIVTIKFHNEKMQRIELIEITKE